MVNPALVDQVRQPGWASRAGPFVAGVASLVIIQPNPWRKEAAVFNNSGALVWATKGDLAALNSGIMLRDGGSMVILPDTTGRIYVGPISVIAVGAGAAMSFTEDW